MWCCSNSCSSRKHAPSPVVSRVRWQADGKPPRIMSGYRESFSLSLRHPDRIKSSSAASRHWFRRGRLMRSNRYWDWASRGVEARIPGILTQTSVTVTRPGAGGNPERVSIRNPLRAYRFLSPHPDFVSRLPEFVPAYCTLAVMADGLWRLRVLAPKPCVGQAQAPLTLERRCY